MCPSLYALRYPCPSLSHPVAMISYGGGKEGAMRWLWIVILVPTALLACGFWA